MKKRLRSRDRSRIRNRGDDSYDDYYDDDDKPIDDPSTSQYYNQFIEHIKSNVVNVNYHRPPPPTIKNTLPSSPSSTSTHLDGLFKQIINNRFIMTRISSLIHTLSVQMVDSNLSPTIYKYDQVIDAQWMLDNGYTQLLKHKLDRCQYVTLGAPMHGLSPLLEKIFKTRNDQLIRSLVAKYPMYFLDESSVDLSCLSGSVDIVKLITSIHNPDRIPITISAMENALKSNSMELVTYLDSSFEETHIPQLEWEVQRQRSLGGATHSGFCRSTNPQVLSYFCSRANRPVDKLTRQPIKYVDGITLLASLNPQLINDHLHREYTFLNQYDFIKYINSIVFFEPISSGGLSSFSPIPTDAFPKDLITTTTSSSPSSPKPLSSSWMYDSKDREAILKQHQPFFKLISTLLPIIFNSNATLESSNQWKQVCEKTDLIMQGINPTDLIYQPLHNMIVAYEMILAVTSAPPTSFGNSGIGGWSIGNNSSSVIGGNNSNGGLFNSGQKYKMEQFHSIACKGPIKLGVVNRGVFTYFVDRFTRGFTDETQPSSYIYANTFLVSYITIDQLKLMLELHPSFSIIGIESGRYSEEVLNLLLEAGVIKPQLVLDQWNHKQLYSDVASVKYLIKNHLPVVFGNGEDGWRVDENTVQLMSESVFMLLLGAGAHPTIPKNTHIRGIEHICQPISHTSRYMLSYLLQKECIGLYQALCGAIKAGNYQLFDELIANSGGRGNAKDYENMAELGLQLLSKFELDYSISHLINTNDFDRFKSFFNLFIIQGQESNNNNNNNNNNNRNKSTFTYNYNNNNNHGSYLPRETIDSIVFQCFRVNNIDFFRRFLNEYPKYCDLSTNLNQLVKKCVSGGNLPFLQFLLQHYRPPPTTSSSSSSSPPFQSYFIKDYYEEACSLGQLDIMKLLNEYYQTHFNKEIDPPIAAVNAAKQGHIHCLIYLQSLSFNHLKELTLWLRNDIKNLPNNGSSKSKLMKYYIHSIIQANIASTATPTKQRSLWDIQP